MRIPLTYILLLSYFLQVLSPSIVFAQQLPQSPSWIQAEKELTSEETAFLDQNLQMPLERVMEAIGLLRGLQLHVEELSAEMGEENLAKQVASHQKDKVVDFVIPDVGRAFLEPIGMGSLARIHFTVELYKSNTIHKFMDANISDFTWLHKVAGSMDEKSYVYYQDQLKHLIARDQVFASWKQIPAQNLADTSENQEATEEILKQERLAEKSPEQKHKSLWQKILNLRSQKAERGKDVFVHYYFNNDKIDTKTYERMSPGLSLSYLKKYWRAIYEKPTTGDKVIGLASGGLQAAITFALGGSPELALLSLAFGVTLGIYTKTNSNWIDTSRTMTGQILKSWVISLAFSYIYSGISKGLGSLIFWTQEGIHNQLRLWTIQFANNMAKTWVQKIARDRAIYGLSAKELTSLRLDQRVLERSGSYLLLFSLKILDMSETHLSLPGLGDIQLGGILLWLSIPFARYASIRYSEKNNFPEAASLRKNWESDKLFGIPYLGILSRQGNKLVEVSLKFGKRFLPKDTEIAIEEAVLETDKTFEDLKQKHSDPPAFLEKRIFERNNFGSCRELFS